MPFTWARWTGGIWLSSADIPGAPWLRAPLQRREKTTTPKPFRSRSMSATPPSERTPPDRTPADRTPWGLVILLGSLTAMGPLAIDMYLPSLPAIAAGLHAASGEAQATVSAFLAGMALGQLVYGPASDRLGRRPPILLGTVVYLAASVFCALA